MVAGVMARTGDKNKMTRRAVKEEMGREEERGGKKKAIMKFCGRHQAFLIWFDG